MNSPGEGWTDWLRCPAPIGSIHLSGALREGRVVSLSMRRAYLLILLTAACARPVLYYPSPGGRAPDPVATTTSPTEKPPTLATSAYVSDASSLSDADYLRARAILIPVAGADMTRVDDSFNEGRDGDRVHRAIDILAPRGTPILSADDGKILRISPNAARR